jgi:hypothetical protein
MTKYSSHFSLCGFEFLLQLEDDEIDGRIDKRVAQGVRGRYLSRLQLCDLPIKKVLLVY